MRLLIGIALAVMMLNNPGGAQDVRKPPAMVPAYLLGNNPQANEFLRRGEFAKAIAALEASGSRDEAERLRRLRRDFSLTPAQFEEKLRATIPDVTAADIEKWRAEGSLQWMTVDGEVRIFRREPSNLFRRSVEARNRRDAAAKAKEQSAPEGDPAAKGTAEFKLEDHMAEVLKLADTNGEEFQAPVRFHIRHTISVPAGRVPAGETIRCWMPLPTTYRQQQGAENLATTPAARTIAPLSAAQRTVYMEQHAQADKPAVFTAEYDFISAAYVPTITEAKIAAAEVNPNVAAVYGKEELPHLPLSPKLRALAAAIVGDEQNPYRKAEKIFRWMDANFQYVSEMEYCVMPSIEEKALAVRGGDCGVFALTFIGLCRASGVPARWQSGWVTRPGYWNMHDWAEFHVDPMGWLPADPSMGLRKSDDPRVRDFLFGHLDAYRMIANVQHNAPLMPQKEYLRSDPVDNQRGEVEWSGGNLYYDDFEYEVEILDATPVKSDGEIKG